MAKIRLATGIHAAPSGGFPAAAENVVAMEKAGVDVVTTGEFYGFDAVSRMGYLAAKTERVQLATSILNVYSRSAALIAMTAASLDEMSGGRFILGLGTSGPQVIEGLHGVPYTKPLARVKDTIAICREVWKRVPLEYSGPALTVPLPPEQGSGLGKPLKLVDHPIRDNIPIWWASLTPKAVEATAEVADGWVPIHVIPDKMDQVWGKSLAAGMAKRSPERPPLDVVVQAAVAIGDNLPVTELRDRSRSTLALYVGGMGAREKNFYNDMAIAYGYADEAKVIQDLYLDGKKKEAAAVVPEEWTEKMNLIGSRSYVAERLAVYKAAGVTTLTINPIGDSDPIKTVELLRELVDDLG